MSDQQGDLYVGTSGWSHNDWRGNFYPSDLRKKEQLPYYADNFQSAELDITFNQFPLSSYINKCKKKVSDNFVFSVCGNSRITHESELRDLKGVMNAFFNRLEDFEQMKTVVWEIPEKIEKDLDRLTEFLEVLPMQWSHGIEFHHESWEDEEVNDLLRQRDVVKVSTCNGNGKQPFYTNGSFSYIRFRGNQSNGDTSIPEDVLENYADKIEESMNDGQDVFAYFLNVEDGNAVKDAGKFTNMVT